MRNVESDLKGLIKIFNECFDRNSNQIPKYNGTEIKPSLYNCGSIESNINGDQYERHIRDGRTLVDALLCCAYNLGAEQALESENMKMKDALIEAQALLIKTLSNK